MKISFGPGGMVWAVVVARVGNGAKSRLSPVLDGDQRSELALAMLADVLERCIAAPVLHGCVAVIDTPRAHEIVDAAGAIPIADPGGDMNAAVVEGLRVALEHGAATAIVLPADVPLLTAADLRTLVRASGDAPRAVVAAPSGDGLGTNALLLRPVDVIAPAFGPPSIERHLAAGRSAGARTVRCAGLALALDVDTPADLARLGLEAPGHNTAAALAAFTLAR